MQISVNDSTNVMLFVVQEDKVIYIINANINLPIDLINTLEYNIYIKSNYMTNVDYSGNGNYDGEYYFFIPQEHISHSININTIDEKFYNNIIV